MHVVEAHGAKIPAIGLGTMTLKEDVCVNAVATALKMGYRHLDTAWFYKNEKEVGEGLRASGVPRQEVFICTKVRETHLQPDDFQRSVDESLANLGLPSVDLLLIHWNNPNVPFKVSIGALCKAKRDGKAKHVGVANFTTTMLDEAWAVVARYSGRLRASAGGQRDFARRDPGSALARLHLPPGHRQDDLRGSDLRGRLRWQSVRHARWARQGCRRSRVPHLAHQ